MRRLRPLLPARGDTPIGSSIRPGEGNALFIIANNIPILVKRIQVRSAIGDAEPSREEPTPPHSGHFPISELPLVDGLQQQNNENDKGDYLRPNDVQIQITDGDGRDNPTDTQIQVDGPDKQPEAQTSNGEDEHEHPHNDEPESHQGTRNDEEPDVDDNDQSVRRRSSPPIGIDRLDDDEDGERHEEEAADIRQQPAQNDRQESMQEAKLYSIPTYLKTHFDILFYLGISPINGNGEKGSRLQQVAFGFVTIMSLLFAFARCKLYVVAQMQSGKLSDYITAWYYASALLLQLGFLWLVVHRYERISAVLQDTTNDKPGIQYKTKQRSISPFAVTFACLAIAVAGVEAARLDHVVDGLLENMGHVVLSHSHTTSMLIFLWNKETNGTNNFYELFAQYGEELTAVTVPMGIFGMIMTFIGTLQEIAIKDILLMASLHTLRLSKIFHSYMVNIFNEKQASDGLTSLFRGTQIHLAEMVDGIESCFGNFFKLIHADYLLYCAHFLAYLINNHINAVYLFGGGVAFLKLVCILYFSTAAIEKSQSVKSVIRKKYSADDCPNEVNLKKVLLLLQTLEESPIAIGRGNFLVDETFALKFVGTVITFFLFFMESDKENVERRRR